MTVESTKGSDISRRRRIAAIVVDSRIGHCQLFLEQ